MLRACSVDGCDRRALDSGLCGAHAEMRRHGRPLRPLGPGRRRRREDPCIVDGCERTVQARGLCPTHYMQDLRRERKARSAGSGARP